MVNELTGGDTLSARFLYGEHFQFRPEFKLCLACNNKPEIRGQDLGIWSRVRVIPFDVVIPPAEQDKKLPAKLRLELSGILNWALEGCLEWQKLAVGMIMDVNRGNRRNSGNISFTNPLYEWTCFATFWNFCSLCSFCSSLSTVRAPAPSR